jgi:hypothetical protein
MTSRSRRQLAVLVVLAALGTVIYVASGREAPATPGAAPSNQSGPQRGGAARPAADATVADVKLELLKETHPELDDPERDPFRFRPRPAPPVKPPPPPPPPGPVGPIVPPGPPPPPPIGLKFIGVMDAPGGTGKIAILSDSRGNVFYGREGDIIDGRFKVLRIGVESAEMSYIDGRGRQTLRLSGQ